MITFNNPQVPPSGVRATDASGLLHMNILLLSAFLLGGCNTKDPIATPVANADYSIIDGDTIKTVVFKDYKKLKDKDPNSKNYIVVGDTIVLYKEPKLHTPPTKDPDLSKLKNNDDPDLKGKPLRYVAIGGSLTAGVRDGGYFNEGILTSYPNLIARQMKLKKFEQPLFDNDSYNGFGRKTRTGFNPTGGPVPKFNEVKNNSGVESVDEKGVKLKVYKGVDNLDNFAIPDMVSASIDPRRKGGAITFNSFSGMSSRINPYQDNKGFVERILQKKFDFFTFELSWNEILQGIIAPYAGGYGPILDQDKYIFGQYIPNVDDFNPGIRHEVRFFRLLEQQKVFKGCILNVPDFTKLPYFATVPNTLLTKVLGNQILYVKDPSGQQTTFFRPETEIFLPTTEVDSLLSSKVHIALKKGIDKNRPLLRQSIQEERNRNEATIGYIKTYNDFANSLSKRFNYPVVDIWGLYNQIFAGKYITHDGVKVDASYPNGNFFSSDGLYPSAFGQSIIANEAIKAINLAYKTEIPLIATKEYLTIK